MWPRLIAFFFAITSVNPEELYGPPEPQIVAFKTGIRVIVPEASGITEFQFHGNVNHSIESFSSGAINLEKFKAVAGNLVLEETNTRLKVGDCVHYWMYVTKDGARYVKHDKVVQITELVEDELISGEGQNLDTSHAKQDPGDNTVGVACSCEDYVKMQKELDRLSKTVKNLEDILTRVTLQLELVN